MAVTIAEGYVYYAGSHERVIVNLDEKLRQETVEMITVVRSLFVSGRMPRAEYGAKCKGCSLVDACLPRAVEKVKHYQEMS